MKHTWQKKTVALQIEYHWWRIRHLRKKPTPKNEERLALHRYRAKQLADYYEVLAGIRDTNGRVIG